MPKTTVFGGCDAFRMAGSHCRMRISCSRDAVDVVPYGHGQVRKTATANQKILLRAPLFPQNNCVFVGDDVHGVPERMKQFIRAVMAASKSRPYSFSSQYRVRGRAPGGDHKGRRPLTFLTSRPASASARHCRRRAERGTRPKGGKGHVPRRFSPAGDGSDWY